MEENDDQEKDGIVSGLEGPASSSGSLVFEALFRAFLWALGGSAFWVGVFVMIKYSYLAGWMDILLRVILIPGVVLMGVISTIISFIHCGRIFRERERTNLYRVNVIATSAFGLVLILVTTFIFAPSLPSGNLLFRLLLNIVEWAMMPGVLIMVAISTLSFLTGVFVARTNSDGLRNNTMIAAKWYGLGIGGAGLPLSLYIIAVYAYARGM